MHYFLLGAVLAFLFGGGLCCCSGQCATSTRERRQFAEYIRQRHNLPPRRSGAATLLGVAIYGTILALVIVALTGGI
jgi:hypothetical protein